jgi:hypothetical protein
METARDLIESAYRKGGVLARGEPLTAEQANDGLELLNDMLQAWRDDYHVDWGLDTLTLASEPAIPAGDIRAVKYNLAVEAAQEEHAAVPDHVMEIAQRSLSALAGRFVGRLRTDFDPALITHGRAFDINSC